MVNGSMAGRIAEAAALPEHEPDPEEHAPEVGPEQGLDLDEGSARLPAVSSHHAFGDIPGSHHHRRVSGPTAGGRSIFPRRVWAELDAVDLSAELRFPVATIRGARFWCGGAARARRVGSHSF